MRVFAQPHWWPAVTTPARPWSRWSLVTVLTLVAALVGARVAAPPLLKSLINQRLAAIPGYTGYVEDVDLSLLRGAYSMSGIRIAKRQADTMHPFVSVEDLDFSIAWGELFRGQVVSEIVAHRPRLNFVQSSSTETSQLDFDRRWQDVIHDLFPIEITHFEVTEGEVHFVAPARDTPVDIFLRDLRVRVRGLRNRPDLDHEVRPATVLAEGGTPGGGVFSLACELEPLAPEPRFHLRLKIDRLALPAINQFLFSYANVDVSTGDFTGYLEMVARNGHYEGYFKPFVENLVFRNAKDAEKGLWARLWEVLVAGVARIMRNNETEQIALRIPFSGEFGATDVGFWESVRTLLRNAFIQALAEGLDGHPRPKGDTNKPATAAALPEQELMTETGAPSPLVESKRRGLVAAP